jgi:hypothetical protein
VPIAATDFSNERLLRLFTSAPKAFWRSDVDVSLSAAVKMARFAQLAGAQSTFYLMPRGMYNLFSREGEEAVAAILDAGHQIGVHVDYRNGSVEEAVERDLFLFKAGYPRVPIGWRGQRRVSFHMPPDCVLWRDFDGFESAYASKWEGRYLADSRGEFGPEKEARVSDDMQINLHPEHWQL